MLPNRSNGRNLPTLTSVPLSFGFARLSSVKLVLKGTPFATKPAHEKMLPSDGILLKYNPAEGRCCVLGVQLVGILIMRVRTPLAKCLEQESMETWHRAESFAFGVYRLNQGHPPGCVSFRITTHYVLPTFHVGLTAWAFIPFGIRR